MRAHIGVVERVGDWALARWSDGAAFATLAREAVLRAAPALRGKVRTRAGDLLNLIYGMSAAALPMVALLNVLVGALVALVVSSAWARDAAPRTSAAQRPRLR
jgi:Na+-transporting NADH:ubiquinone oxidoreductase subunit NqrB